MILDTTTSGTVRQIPFKKAGPERGKIALGAGRNFKKVSQFLKSPGLLDGGLTSETYKSIFPK